jgi:uncharacterized membrane protein
MSQGSETDTQVKRHTMQHFFLRGLAISLPAILTILVLLWLIGGFNHYIIGPTTESVKYVIAQFVDRSIPADSKALQKLRPTAGVRYVPELRYCGENYLVTTELRNDYAARQRRERERIVSQDASGTTQETIIASFEGYNAIEHEMNQWLLDEAIDRFDSQATPPFAVYVPLGSDAVPYRDFAIIARDTPAGEMPTSATALYMEYAVRRYVGSAFLLSIFALSLVIVGIYFLGRFVSVRVGSWLVNLVETRMLGRLPVIRNVYGSAKQVTDFLFSENQVEYRRVVAIEYPRRGIWSLALVTGEGMLDITSAIGEPCVSVLVPSSPMPVTGYTMCVPRSSLLDLNVTVDQAFQFCISCGVLVPDQQKVTPEVLQRELARRLAERMQDNPTDRRTLQLPPTVRPVEARDDDDGGS